MAKKKSPMEAQKEEMELIAAEINGDSPLTAEYEESLMDSSSLAEMADDMESSDEYSGDWEPVEYMPALTAASTPKKRGVPKGTKRGPSSKTIPGLLMEYRNEIELLTSESLRNERLEWLNQRIAHFESMMARHEAEKASAGEKLVNRLADSTADTALTHLLNKRRQALLDKGIPAEMVDAMLQALS